MSRLSSYIAKISESNIIKEYSIYLQMISLNTEWLFPEKINISNHTSLLSYDEFKEYYISGLTGKDNFINSLVNEFQFSLARD